MTDSSENLDIQGPISVVRRSPRHFQMTHFPSLTSFIDALLIRHFSAASLQGPPDPQRLFDCLKSLHDKTHVCLLSLKTLLFMPGVSFCLWKADFTLNVTLSEKHSSTILSIPYLCLPARSVSFNISTSLFGGFYFPFLNGLKKEKKNLWSDIKTFLLNVKHAQSAGVTGGFSKFHHRDKKPGLAWST